MASAEAGQINGASLTPAIASSKSFQSLAEYVAAEPDIRGDAKSNILAALHNLAPLQTDPWIYRMVVFFLGTIVLVTVVGGVLVGKGGGLSDGIVAIGSAAVGALAGLLAPSPMNKS
jgi:hypothetical protein